MNIYMQRHSKYKPVRSSYLCEIPEHWHIVPGFVALRENRRDNKGMKERRVLSLSYGKIIVKPEEKLVGLVPESFETYQVAKPGDIIVRCTDLQNDKTSLRTGLVEDFGIITSAYLNLASNKGFSGRYLHYFLHSLDTTKVLYQLGTGLRQNLSYQDFKRFPVVSPPFAEQVIIAGFLDRKTIQIDKAISVKEQQITLLKERKQILIQNAVTRGLNSNAPMRDSGVEWIGEIPIHWSIKRAKYLFQEVDERSPHGQEELLSVSHMTGVTPRSEKSVSMFMAEDYTGSKTCQSGDLVFNIMWAWMGALGVSDRSGIVSSSYGIFRQLKTQMFNSQYLEMLLKTIGYIEHYNKVSTGLHSSRLRFYSHMFMAMEIGYPDLEEQNTIVEHINLESGRLDKAVEILSQQITKLKEYKATLINSAVTGKVKVPGVVEPGDEVARPDMQELPAL